MRVGRWSWLLIVASASAAVAASAGACTSSPEAPPKDAGYALLDTNVPVDTSVPDVGPFDTAAPRPCDLAKPFGAPTALTELNSAFDELSVRFSADELTAYLESNRNSSGDGPFEVFVATRKTKTSPFGAPVLLDAVNDMNGSSTQRPTISPDGKILLVSSSRGTGISHVYGSFSLPDGGFTPPAIVGGTMVSDTNQSDPYIDPTGTRVYFVADLQGQDDIYAGGVASDGGVDLPARIDELSAAGIPSDAPVVSADALELYFATNRSDASFATEIYRSERGNTTDPWGAPTEVTELSTGTFESPSWLSPDRCTLVFASAGFGDGDARHHLYSANRPK